MRKLVAEWMVIRCLDIKEAITEEMYISYSRKVKLVRIPTEEGVLFEDDYYGTLFEVVALNATTFKVRQYS